MDSLSPNREVAIMRTLVRSAAMALVGLSVLGLGSRADDLTKGTPELRSAGPMAFGPDGILFVGDTSSAAVFAIDTGDRGGKPGGSDLKVEGIDQKIAAALGTTKAELLINDLAVNPASGNAYLSVARGRGRGAMPVIVRVDRAGKIEPLALENVRFAKAELPNPPEPGLPKGKGPSPRAESITDLAYVDGRLFVAGLSGEEFSSRLLAIPYPFKETKEGTSVEIFHGSHGQFETRSPVRTFVAYRAGGQDYLLAAYTCTPLVKIPVADLKPGSHVKGTTIAELGNRNRPLDMVVYKKDGKDYLLLSNNSRGVMKIPTTGLDSAEGIVKPVRDKEGVPYETVASLKGVTQLDIVDPTHALVLVQSPGGAMNLETIAMP
jgi:hypothetical protein